jgi:phosphoribosyl 1,2-cyclic phosphodiesterase
MIITCWGARGSIPVSGKEYIKYGGSTTCIEITTKDNETIIIDAGSGIRKLGNKLLAEGQKEYNIIFTHAHWDHILGFPFFKPIYHPGTRITMMGCPFAQESVKQIIARTMSHPNFPVDFNNVQAKLTYHELCIKPFSLKSLTITPILLNHPNQGMGYKFAEGNKSFVFLTDNELTFKHEGGLDYADYLRFVSGTDILIHDAEFTPDEYKLTRGWGHTVYQKALKLALEGRVKRFGLFHHNQERTDAALDAMVKDCKRAIKQHKSDLECFAVAEGMQIKL